jgi:hypothetical protein
MVEGKVLDVKEGQEAITEGIIYDEKGNVCSRSTGTYTLFSVQAITRKGVSIDKVIEWFERFIQVK